MKRKKRMGDEEEIGKRERKMMVIGDREVMVDRDVGELYGVERKGMKEGVKRKMEKFGGEYMFELRKEEKEEVVRKCEEVGKLGYCRSLGNGLREEGLYMVGRIVKWGIGRERRFGMIERLRKVGKVGRSMGKVNEEGEEGMVGDEGEEGKLEGMMNEVFGDKVGLKMGKFGFRIKVGMGKIWFERRREGKD